MIILPAQTPTLNWRHSGDGSAEIVSGIETKNSEIRKNKN